MAPSPDLLTASEAAKYLGVSAETVRRWAKTSPPQIGHVRLPSGRMRFRRSDLDAALKVHEPAA